jgi:hypothetical protein
MPTRRNLLRGALVAAAAAPIVTLFDAAAFAATRIPLTVVNNTGRYANSSIWIYIVGTDLATGNQCYVRADGTLVPVSASLNGSDGFADLSIPFAAAGNTIVSLPNMSGRIYVSIGTKLKFKVVTDGNGHAALQYPAGWVASDPSYAVLHDCMEFTFNGAGMFCNTTMVDMFSVPLAITLTGASTQTTGTLVNGGRDAIFAAIAAQSDFSRLIVAPGGTNLRVIAPGHGIDAGLFSSTYYDSYISDVWSAYASQTLSVTINATTYTGHVTNNQLVFSGGVAPFTRPSTQNVFYCNGALSAPNDGLSGPVAAILGAAFNRSTLRAFPAQPVSNPAQFYQQPITNHYSQAIHQNTVDGKAYGFPFDDVGTFASFIQDAAPSAITLTLTPFAGSGGGGTASLLSLNKPATASSLENASLPASNAVDGNAGTRWSSAFADPQWIQVDLGTTHQVSRVQLTWEAAFGRSYRIDTSTDGGTWHTVFSATTGDGGTDNVTFAATAARFVRMFGTARGTPYGYSLWAMDVYGT